MKINNTILIRDSEIGKYINQCQLKTFDNIEYKYLWLGTYRLDYSNTAFNGWTDDAFKIKYKDVDAGFIRWYYDRDNESISSVIIYLEPNFLNSGLGVISLVKFLDYIFIERGIRKVTHTVCPENKRAFKIYNKCPASKLVGIHRREVKLWDNTYADLAEFDIMKEDYISFRKNSKLFR